MIDLIAFYIITLFIIFLIEFIFPGSISDLNINEVLERIISIILYGLVMFVIEAAFQGKSLGKLITGTRAVNYDGETLSLKQFLIRNFIRAIPFNALSAFGNPCAPWHDTWSDTLVVDEKKLSLEIRKDEFYTDLKNQES